MTGETVNVIADFISQDILKQPRSSNGSARRLDASTRLISSGLVDSLTIVDLAIFVEDRFGVKLKPNELNAETFDTLGDLAKLIEARQQAGERR